MRCLRNWRSRRATTRWRLTVHAKAARSVRNSGSPTISWRRRTNNWAATSWRSRHCRRPRRSATGTARYCRYAVTSWRSSGAPVRPNKYMHTLDAASRDRYVPPYATALVHAGLRQRDAVYAWLQRAYDAHDVHLALLVIDPKWDGFRAEPQFEALLMRCGFTNAI